MLTEGTALKALASSFALVLAWLGIRVYNRLDDHDKRIRESISKQDLLQAEKRILKAMDNNQIYMLTQVSNIVGNNISIERKQHKNLKHGFIGKFSDEE